jgi:hypothetical protein
MADLNMQGFWGNQEKAGVSEGERTKAACDYEALRHQYDAGQHQQEANAGCNEP